MAAPNQSLCASPVSALIVDEQRRERRAVAACRAACSRRVVGSRGRERVLQCLQELLQEIGNRTVAGRRIRGAVGRRRTVRWRRSRRRTAGAAGSTRAAGPACSAWTIGKGRLEHALQLGGLVAGQLAGGDFA